MGVEKEKDKSRESEIVALAERTIGELCSNIDRAHLSAAAAILLLFVRAPDRTQALAKKLTTSLTALKELVEKLASGEDA